MKQASGRLYSTEVVAENGASSHNQFLQGVFILMAINDPKAIETILNECRTIAVVGLSSNPMRPSYDVARYLQRQGYRIIPVNPNETEVLGEPAFPSLAAVPENFDLVDIFRRSEEAGEHVDEAIKLGARAVWMQDGVIDEAAAERALKAGLLVVMDNCILREHARRR
ncbi:MAG TPA: CoA-binding protein [Blastocatellia bacterium]